MRPSLQRATLVFSAEKNGSLRVLYQGWDEPKVFPPGGGVEVVSKGGKVLVFRKEPTPAEVAAATSDPYEDWDIAGTDTLTGCQAGPLHQRP